MPSTQGQVFSSLSQALRQSSLWYLGAEWISELTSYQMDIREKLRLHHSFRVHSLSQKLIPYTQIKALSFLPPKYLHSSIKWAD